MLTLTQCWTYTFANSGGCPIAECLASANRRDLRQKLNLRGNGCLDCLSHFCLPCCALSQEDYELKNQLNRDILMAEKGRKYTIRTQPRQRHEKMQYVAEGSAPGA